MKSSKLFISIILLIIFTISLVSALNKPILPGTGGMLRDTAWWINESEPYLYNFGGYLRLNATLLSGSNITYNSYYNYTYNNYTTESNSSWNETYADTIYTSFLYVDSLGNWSNDKSDYYTSAQIEGFNYYNVTDFNIADYSTISYVDLIIASIGNWSADKSSYYTKTTSDDRYINEDGDAGLSGDYTGTYNLNTSGYIDAVVVRELHLTSATYNGNLGGYVEANNKCKLEFEGTHLCSEDDILNFLSYDNTSIPSGDAWVSAGGPKYIPATVPVNDCNGWTYSGTSTYLGNYWHLDSSTGGDSRALNCGTELKLTCCR